MESNMALASLVRDYSMTDAELCGFAFELVSKMTRDITYFNTRGVTATDISDLETLAEAFQAFPNDEYYRADVSLAVQSKTSTREGMQVLIRDIVQCAIIKWGEQSPQYKKFSAQKMTSEGDKIFISTARQVVLVATNYLTVLSDVGLTASMISSLTTATDLFHSQLIAINDAQELRDNKTQERISKGNEIYSLITRYCTIGKIIWDDVDESKYNDYVIYHRQAEMPSKVQNVHYDMATNKLYWEPAAYATSYEAQYKSFSPTGPNPDWSVIYTGADLSVIYSPGVGEWLFRVRGININGNGEWSDELAVDI